MEIALQATLVTGTLLCALVAGLLLTFAIVVMPGIGRLSDRGFVRAFQEIDGVIQRGQPLFGVLWLGSTLSLLAACGLGFGRVGFVGQMLLAAVAVVWLAGVQVPTFVVNIPLNNALQRVDAETDDEAAWRSARQSFEAPWNRWNGIRTALAVLAAATLAVLLSRLAA